MWLFGNVADCGGFFKNFSDFQWDSFRLFDNVAGCSLFSRIWRIFWRFLAPIHFLIFQDFQDFSGFFRINYPPRVKVKKKKKKKKMRVASFIASLVATTGFLFRPSQQISCCDFFTVAFHMTPPPPPPQQQLQQQFLWFMHWGISFRDQ